MVTQQQIARRVGVDISSVNKILNRRVGPRFRKDTVARVFRVARDLGFEFGKLKHFHRRRYDRRPTEVAVDVSVRRSDGTTVEAGSGILKELSPGGALLCNLRLASGRLPLVPFDLVLRWRKGAGMQEARGRVVRLRLEERSVAVEFSKPPGPAGIPAGGK